MVFLKLFGLERSRVGSNIVSGVVWFRIRCFCLMFFGLLGWRKKRSLGLGVVEELFVVFFFRGFGIYMVICMFYFILMVFSWF